MIPNILLNISINSSTNNSYLAALRPGGMYSFKVLMKFNQYASGVNTLASIPIIITS